MFGDPGANQLIRSFKILKYVEEEGEKGAELNDIWGKFRNIGSEVPRASIINQADRLVSEGHLVEVKESDPHGYVRRFYDPKYVGVNEK
jgi:hypothetical protein